ncbi:BTAD domain-containing putative transcriptional regulator [Myceligenerans halotolerans]
MKPPAGETSGVTIRLLGGVEAVSAAGERFDVGPPKCQVLLAALALSAGTAVPVWRLVEAVWGDRPPRTAERTLQSYITRLRGSLGPDVVVRSGSAYRLDLPRDSVDVLRFRRAADAGRLAEALGEWTGHPLSGVEAPGLAAEVDGLIERWLRAVEAQLTADIDTEPGATIAWLTELTARYPFREELSALQITALYRIGRQADALAAYRAVRRRMVDELGVEPTRRLRELEKFVLSQDRRLEGSRQAPRGGNLPVRTPRLVGREGDLSAVEDALRTCPVVTLVGPGGVGKTALALAAAQQVSAGNDAWLVDLTEISADRDVARAVAAELGVKEGPGRSLDESVVVALRPSRAVVVLDNCDHVVHGAAELSQAMASGCPEVRILATSREALGLGPDERLFPVPPLPPDGAGADLFEERATALSPGFDPRSNRAVVEKICRRLDGLPLAIELAAARTTSLTPDELLGRLDDQLRLLVGGRRTGAGRHRTMRATVDWSYDLLDPSEQAVFQRLSVFAGAFGQDGAEAASAGTEIDVDAALHALVVRSMVVAEPSPFGQRYRMLEPIRQFAAERLDASGTAEIARSALPSFLRQRIAHIHGLLAGAAESEGIARLDALWPDLRATVDRACLTNDHQLVFDLVRPIASEGTFRNRQEIGHWAERLLAMIPPADAASIVVALAAAAPRYHLRQDPAGFDRLVERYGDRGHPVVRHLRAHVHDDFAAQIASAPDAAACLRHLGASDLAELIEVDLGAALVFQGSYVRGDTVLGSLVERFRTQGPPTLLNWSLMLLGFSAAFQGARERAERLFDEGIDLLIPDRTHSPNRTVRAGVLFRRGDRADGVRLLRSYVDELLDTDNMQGSCVAAVEFVGMMTAADRLPDCARILGFLDTTGFLDNSGWATMVAGPREVLDRADDVVQADGAVRADRADPITDHRRALDHMRATLSELLEVETANDERRNDAPHP